MTGVSLTVESFTVIMSEYVSPPNKGILKRREFWDKPLAYGSSSFVLYQEICQKVCLEFNIFYSILFHLYISECSNRKFKCFVNVSRPSSHLENIVESDNARRNQSRKFSFLGFNAFLVAALSSPAS